MGHYITFLDCDDVWFPDKLHLQVKAFEQYKHTGLIHTNVEVLEQYGSSRILHRKIQPSGQIFKKLLKKYHINLQTVMITREVLDYLDEWFDESMLFSGDADMFLRIAKEYDILYLPQISARYREHGTSLSATRVEVLLHENERILENLSQRYDGFMDHYQCEVAQFRINALLAIINAKWKYVSGREARKSITGHLTVSCIFPILYVLSFLPYRVVQYMKRCSCMTK